MCYKQKSKHSLSINNKQLLVKYFLVKINFDIKAYMNKYQICASQATLTTRVIKLYVYWQIQPVRLHGGRLKRRY